KRTVAARVVALDQVVVINRMGTVRPSGLVYALERDVVPMSGTGPLSPGNVRLRDDKRPRPIVLRMNVGDCIDVTLTNLLAPAPPKDPLALSPAPITTRNVGLHVSGLSVVDSAAGTTGGPNDGTFAGQNQSSLVEPGKSHVYRLHAGVEGTFLVYSTAADFNGVLTQQLTLGLFGAMTVEPETSEQYRSQVSHADFELARKRDTHGKPLTTPDGHPLVDYAALFPPDHDTTHPGSHGRACAPILRMIDVPRAPVREGDKLVCKEVPGSLEVYHTDLTAIVTGPGAGRFPDSAKGQLFEPNPEYPDRRAPYREITVHYHESQDVLQPFSQFYDGTPDSHGLPSSYTLTAGLDASGSEAFAINYSIAGISAEVLANRLGVGPAYDCPECKFESSSSAHGLSATPPPSSTSPPTPPSTRR
ncbi:MAG: hypothetical protein R3B70_08750, partial [Polyangiaceae bacterium]